MVLGAWLVMDQVVFMDVSQWSKVVTMTPRPWTQTLAMVNVDHEHTDHEENIPCPLLMQLVID